MKLQLQKIVPGACLVAALGISACSDNDFGGQQPAGQGERVHFAAGQLPEKSRTAYDDENIFQINWQQDDLVKIYADKSFNNVPNCNYKVTPQESDDKMTDKDGNMMYPGNKVQNQGLIFPTTEVALEWADAGEHQFVAVYPDNVEADINFEQGTVTLPVHRDQTGRAVKVAGSAYAAGPYAPYTYYVEPDMTNQYLVAYKALTAAQANVAGGEVFLGFKPVMTTLEVVVSSSPENSLPITVTGLSVLRDMPVVEGEDYNTFVWDAKNNCLAASEVHAPTADKFVETISVDMTTDDQTGALTLNQGESVVFTVFLPPYAVNADYPFRIKVNATGSVTVVTNEVGGKDNEHIAGSTKRRITIDPMPIRNGGNDWISYLDDHILISQLSIPGSFNSATGNVSNKGNVPITQVETMHNQMLMGVRAFDLTVQTDNNGVFKFYEDKWAIEGITMEGFFKDLKDYLAEHPRELFVVYLKSTPDGAGNGWNTIGAVLQREVGDYLAKFQPDMIIGEARGKIVLFVSNPFDGYQEMGLGQIQNFEETYGTNIGTLYINYKGGQTAKLLYQNFITTVTADTKYQAVKALFDKAAPYHVPGNSDANTWIINEVFGKENASVNAKMYARLASQLNPMVYNYLHGSEKPLGSTGIAYLMYVGGRQATVEGETNTVYGDLLPQAIVDNNFKFRLLRRGE